MLNATVELVMSEYFLMKAVLGKYLEDSERLFTALSEIFLIHETDVKELYRLSENETARNINSDKEFMQHQRMQKYSQLIGSFAKVNAAWEEVVRIKGNAILIAQSNNLVLDSDASRNVVYTSLSSAATGGVVSALRMMGILQCEGIFFSKNDKAGVKNLTKSADWNDSVSTLALLHYCKDTREYNLERLRQEVKYTPFEEVYISSAKKYGEADTVGIEEVRLLEKAFNSGVLKRENYDAKYARIINSNVLFTKDKEKAVFTLNKELLCAISDLPLKLSRAKIAPVDTNALNKVTVKREAEIFAITRALKNSDLRELSSYRPLCLCCESKYILDMYARVIKAKSANNHVETIDVGELCEYDFEPTPNNIFIRSIDEDKDNRFILTFRGDIPEGKINAIKSVLQSAKRAKFHLNSPNVTLNLSSVLPVCFCDERNLRALKPYCDIIMLSEVTTDEMPIAIQDIVATKEKVYGLRVIKINGDVADVFKGYDIDAAEKLIDEAVRARREKGAVITLTREILQEYATGNNKQIIGFGGDINERH